MFLTSVYNENILIDITQLYNNKNNVNFYIENMLKKTKGNKCNSDGLIIKNTISIINRNTGTFTLNHNLLYNITYRADILCPNEGSILRNCRIIFVNEVVYIAQLLKYNIICIIPKTFINYTIDIKSNINIICLDKYFELNDHIMFVIGIPDINNIKSSRITLLDENDNKCVDIVKHLTEFKHDYYNLFYDNKIDDDDKVDITYDLYDYNINIKLNHLLVNLKELLIQHIKQNSYLFDSLYIENINTLSDFYILLESLSITHFNKIYYDFKYNIYTNYDETIYLQEKAVLLNANIEKISDEGIINSNNYCYIISAIQMLKHSKLFLVQFRNLYSNLSDIIPAKLPLFHELNKLFFQNKNNISDFISILLDYIEEHTLNWNFNQMNDINDFIYILFNIIDTIPFISYKKNVYDLVISDYSDKIPSLLGEYDNININLLITNINSQLNVNLFKSFYCIHVNECICHHCNYKYYHIYNSLIYDIFMEKKHIHNVLDYLNSSLNNETHIIGEKCPICSHIEIYKTNNIYIDSTDSLPYFICSFNRFNFNSFNIEKNLQSVDINNRLSLQLINIEKSINSIEYKNVILDLKSVICHTGTFVNGHYFIIHKDKSDMFYLYNDEKIYKITNNNFYNDILYKQNSYTFIYQVNSIHDLPLSNINLLQYEHNVLNNYEDDITLYIKDKTDVGIHLGPAPPLFGGTLFKNLTNIYYLFSNYSILLTIDDFKNILSDICSNYINIDVFIPILQKFNSTYTTHANKEVYLKEFIGANQDYLQNIDSYIYYYILLYIIKQIHSLYDPSDVIQFINNIDFLNNTNIFIGSAGYNTSETNYWDLSYEYNPNNLDLYAQHFNSIEINHTYYNDYEIDHWNDIFDKLNKLTTQSIRLSILFNKELSELLINATDIVGELKIQEIFNKYYKSKMSILSNYIDNILFKFESDFIYNEVNFSNLKLFVSLKSIIPSHINLIFEFYDISWYSNTTVIKFFNENNLSMTSLIFNNDNYHFGHNLPSNLFKTKLEQLDYCNFNFPVNYIKLYGSKHKYNGSHTKELPFIVKNIKDKLNIKLLQKIPKNDENIKQYIYFNNIETDKDNNKYNENDENTNLPSAIYDAKTFYKLLEKIDKL